MAKQFTSEDADRLCGLGDQFMEDWAETAIRDSNPDTDYEERAAQWNAIRPLFVAAPDLLAVLKAGDLENWVANAALTTDIETLRAICLEWADWWNNLAVPVIDKAEGKTV